MISIETCTNFWDLFQNSWWNMTESDRMIFDTMTSETFHSKFWVIETFHFISFHFHFTYHQELKNSVQNSIIVSILLVQNWSLFFTWKIVLKQWSKSIFSKQLTNVIATVRKLSVNNARQRPLNVDSSNITTDIFNLSR